LGRLAGRKHMHAQHAPRPHRVLAFEPVPRFHAFLEFSVHLNGLAHLVGGRGLTAGEGRAIVCAPCLPCQPTSSPSLFTLKLKLPKTQPGFR
jgi:hypothetical protein